MHVALPAPFPPGCIPEPESPPLLRRRKDVFGSAPLPCLLTSAHEGSKTAARPGATPLPQRELTADALPTQVRHRPKAHYMRKQPDITDGMRRILVDWLVEVAEEYKLRAETLYLAVNFLDRFLSCMSVLRGKLQLVGTAAILLAS